ncbi:MAG: hypothetical protein ABWY25_03520 [Paenisporosarcina sp.]
MLRRFVKEKSSVLDEPIAHILSKMNKVGPESEEYPKLVNQLERLYRLQREPRRSRINPDVMAIVAGNLVGILIIVMYEQKHVVTSKGLGFILKARQPLINS